MLLNSATEKDTLKHQVRFCPAQLCMTRGSLWEKLHSICSMYQSCWLQPLRSTGGQACNVTFDT